MRKGLDNSGGACREGQNKEGRRAGVSSRAKRQIFINWMARGKMVRRRSRI
jgi:hypothetical protein